MNKKKYLSWLKSIEKLLGSLPSIDDLKARIESLPDEEVENKPLVPPAEIAELENALALYTDGACRGNPGVGAWAYLVQNKIGEILAQNSGGENLTTNNRMELTGVIEALGYLQNNIPEKYSKFVLYTDSKYAVDGLNQWVPQWKSRGWKKADNKVPENVDLWQRLDELFNTISQLEIKWVKGHAGHPQNEYCDKLCNEFLDENNS